MAAAAKSLAAGGAQAVRFIDIGANLSDAMFQGMYRGKRKHVSDWGAMLGRAAEAGVSHALVTGGSLEDSQQALHIARTGMPPVEPTMPSPDAAAPSGGGSGGGDGTSGPASGTGAGASVTADAAADGTLVASTGVELFSTVGIHPTRSGDWETYTPSSDGASADASDVPGPAGLLSRLLAIAKSGQADGKVVAIGECGLDYDRLDFASKEAQLKYFGQHLDMAESCKLPLFLHSRACGTDLADILRDNRERFPGGVVHSFDDTADVLRSYLDIPGLYIGVNGCSLKTEDNLSAVKQIPLDRLMIETDAPWCGVRPTHAGNSFVKTRWPEKKPDKWVEGSCVKGRSEPCHIVQVAEIVAAVHGVEVEEVARVTTANAEALFFPDRSS